MEFLQVLPLSYCVSHSLITLVSIRFLRFARYSTSNNVTSLTNKKERTRRKWEKTSLLPTFRLNFCPTFEESKSTGENQKERDTRIERDGEEPSFYSVSFFNLRPSSLFLWLTESPSFTASNHRRHTNDRRGFNER